MVDTENAGVSTAPVIRTFYPDKCDFTYAQFVRFLADRLAQAIAIAFLGRIVLHS